MSDIWKNNKQYFIPAILGLISLFVGYAYRDCKEGQIEKGSLETNVKNINESLADPDTGLGAINKNLKKQETNLGKIGDCLIRDIIPVLNQISNQRPIQPIQLASLSKSITETLSKIIAVQNQITFTNEILASLNQGIQDA